MYFPNTKQKIPSQWGKGRFPSRNTARLYKRVLAKWCLPVHRIFFALLKGKVKITTAFWTCLDVLLPEGATESLHSLKWKGKNKKARCAFCLLSVTSQYFLNIWGATWRGGVAEYHFKWRQFSGLKKKYLQIKVTGDTPRSISEIGPLRSSLILSWLDQRQQWVTNCTHLFSRRALLRTHPF